MMISNSRPAFSISVTMSQTMMPILSYSMYVGSRIEYMSAGRSGARVSALGSGTGCRRSGGASGRERERKRAADLCRRRG